MGNGSKWWVTLIEGIVAILLGLYLLVGGDAAAGNFALVAGILIFIIGVIELWRGSGSVSRWRGIIGVIVGALILLLYAFDIFNTQFDFTIFAIGVILVGALGLYGSLFARSGRKFAWGPVLINALLLLWGISIFFFRGQDADLQNVTALILIAIGVVMIIWGFVNRGGDEPEEVTTPDKPAVEEAVEDTPDQAP